MKISSIETATPAFLADPQSVKDAAAIWLGAETSEYALFARYLSSSKTLSRYFVRPPKEIVKLRGSKMQAEIFEKEATALSMRSVDALLKKTKIDPGKVDGLIFTSCSCPLIPAPDTYLIDHFGFKRDIVRIPAYQFGCAGGMIGLGLAHRLRSELETIILVSTELCSLVFQEENRSPSNLVGASIFGDGSAAALLQKDAEGGLEIIAHRSFLIPESRHLMGYDIRDSGAHLRLDKELPMHLADSVPRLTDEFLKEHGIKKEEVKWWLFHPGGVKILNYLQSVLDLKADQAWWAEHILTHVGNLSSATILFVINAFFAENQAKPGDKVAVLGVGPGLTIEVR
jgi:alkylresorcinol/alkylpyrone synthase